MRGRFASIVLEGTRAAGSFVLVPKLRVWERTFEMPLCGVAGGRERMRVIMRGGNRPGG
jgi:hypothetical protein